MGLLEFLTLAVLLAFLLALLKPEIVVKTARSIRELSSGVEEGEDLLRRVAKEMEIDVEGKSDEEIAREIIEKVKG